MGGIPSKASSEVDCAVGAHRMHLCYNGVKNNGSSANLRQIDDAGMSFYTGVTNEKQGEASCTSLSGFVGLGRCCRRR